MGPSIQCMMNLSSDISTLVMAYTDMAYNFYEVEDYDRLGWVLGLIVLIECPLPQP